MAPMTTAPTPPVRAEAALAGAEVVPGLQSAEYDRMSLVFANVHRASVDTHAAVPEVELGALIVPVVLCEVVPTEEAAEEAEAATEETTEEMLRGTRDRNAKSASTLDSKGNVSRLTRWRHRWWNRRRHW